MTKKSVSTDKNTEMKPTKTDEGFLYPDGILIRYDVVNRDLNNSNLSKPEIEALESVIGKSHELLYADNRHKHEVERREKEEAFKLRQEAENEKYRLARVETGKRLFNDKTAILLKDGVISTELPPFSDEDFIKIADLDSAFNRYIYGVEDIRAAIELGFISKKYPGYVVFVKSTIRG